MRGKLVLFLLLFSISFSSALTIEDTIFSTSVTNYTVHVDKVILTSTNTTNLSLIFTGVDSSGSNFTNINSSLIAIVEFVNLSGGLTIHNKNTSTDIFSSEIGARDFNATIPPHNVIIINAFKTIPKTDCERIVDTMGGALALFSEQTSVVFLTILAIIILISIILVQTSASIQDAKNIFVAFFVLILLALLLLIILSFVQGIC